MFFAMTTETEAGEASTTDASTSAGGPAPAPGPGKILIWSVHFPARDPENPDDPGPAPTLTASVTLDGQDGAVVHARAGSVIDYESGAINRGDPVQVRYEPLEDSDDPAWVFDLVEVVDSPASDGDG
jgi:uncharacterized OB-fold protein